MTVKELIHYLQNEYHPEAKVYMFDKPLESVEYLTLGDLLPDSELKHYTSEQLRTIRLVLK